MSKSKYANTGLLGEPEYTTVGGLYASTILPAKSGRYLVLDISDACWRAPATNEAAVNGYVDQHLESGKCSATKNGTKLSIATNVTEFATEMPYSESEAAVTLTAAKLVLATGVAGDFYVASNVQYWDNASSQDVLKCVGGDVAEGTVYVVVLSATSISVS